MSDQLQRESAIKAAKAYVSGDLSLIECSVSLASLAHSLVPDWTKDEEFALFGVLASETDHLPCGTARQYWSEAALKDADGQIARIEENYRDEAVRACLLIIERFGSA